MNVLTKGLVTLLMAGAPVFALGADAPSGGGVTVGNETARDFFIAHKDAAKVQMRGTSRQETGVLVSIGQDNFCTKPARNAPDTQIWCNLFANLTYYNYDGTTLTYSFTRP